MHTPGFVATHAGAQHWCLVHGVSTIQRSQPAESIAESTPVCWFCCRNQNWRRRATIRPIRLAATKARVPGSGTELVPENDPASM
jgi:hypothetical protein